MAEAPKHECTQKKLKEIAQKHYASINALYDEARKSWSAQLDGSLELALDEALGTLGIDEDLIRRNELAQELAEIDARIARTVGTKPRHLESFDPNQMAAGVRSYLQSGYNMESAMQYYVPEGLREEAKLIMKRRGWITDGGPQDWPAPTGYEHFKHRTATLAEVAEIVNAEQSQALEVFKKYQELQRKSVSPIDVVADDEDEGFESDWEPEE